MGIPVAPVTNMRYDNDGLNLAWYGAREVVVPRVAAAGPGKTYLDNWDLKFLSLGQVGTGE